MNRDNLVLKVIPDWCKGCMICVNLCPKNVLELDEDNKIVIARPEDCIKCGQCELRCPDFAIYLEGDTDEK